MLPAVFRISVAGVSNIVPKGRIGPTHDFLNELIGKRCKREYMTKCT